MLVAIATCLALNKLPPDELALLDALGELGISATAEIWSSSDTDWSTFGAVVVRSCWDYHLRVDEFRRWLGHLHKQNILVINPASLIQWNFDKRYLQELCPKGVAIPNTIWLASGEHLDLGDACRANGWETAVVKPLISASAYRTERRREGMVQGPLMIQEYVSEIESEGEWSLMYFSGTFSHAVKKRATPGEFRVQSDFGGTAELLTPPRRVLQAADRVMAVQPSTPVFARVDMIEQGASVLLMELELIEPELFLTLAPGASRRLARAVHSTINNAGNN